MSYSLGSESPPTYSKCLVAFHLTPYLLFRIMFYCCSYFPLFLFFKWILCMISISLLPLCPLVGTTGRAQLKKGFKPRGAHALFFSVHGKVSQWVSTSFCRPAEDVTDTEKWTCLTSP